MIDDQNVDAAHHIEKRHERHKHSTYFEMLCTPPMMTAAPRRVTIAPVMYGLMPYWFSTSVEMAFACTVLPMPKEARAAKRAKRIPNHFHPNPFSRAYIGPPSISPRLVLTRYFTARRPSAYLVEIPKTPVSQHQNTAPGPPRAMAVATPMILPVPMVAARAVARLRTGRHRQWHSCPS